MSTGATAITKNHVTAPTAGRRRIMRAIRSKNTKPELLIRSLVHALGYRFRLHRADLPGKPDLVFGPRRKVIFVHGCFWHSHPDQNCRNSQKPKSNKSYWLPKLARNAVRDAQQVAQLRAENWRALVIWECELNDEARLVRRIKKFLG